MIASSPEFLYVHEPFNVTSPSPYFLGKCSRWFHYLRAGESSDVAAAMRGLCAYELDPVERILRIRGLRGRDGAKWQLMHMAKLLQAKVTSQRPLVKDPLALFSAPWLHQELHFRPIVTMRHPAAFAGALKRANWHFDFRNLSEQSNLMQDLIGPWAGEVDAAARKPLELIPMACLLWNVLHDVIARFRTEHPNWYFVRHEDLARDPLPGFGQIFDWLGLPMREEVRARILDYSTVDGFEVGEGSLVNIKRVSHAQVFSWKERLTPGEIAEVRRKTERVAANFYDDTEW